ncbi:hypothetical protein F4778DRAFT_781236 [Xylariomycetidae sp. FL2044]|nr:hypothetical protein F4778DRAFT_781236 [Xylariomycetidae sp. FL2044]
MAFVAATSDPITMPDMAALINWEKLATRAGFKDAAAARAHYEPFLKPDRPGTSLTDREGPRDIEGRSERAKAKHASLADLTRVKKEESNYTDSCFTSGLYDMEDGEV